MLISSRLDGRGQGQPFLQPLRPPLAIAVTLPDLGQAPAGNIGVWVVGLGPGQVAVDLAQVGTGDQILAARERLGLGAGTMTPGFSLNGQVCDDHQDAVVAVAEVLNQFRHGFTAGGVPEYAETFSEALNDLMAKHWPGGT